MTDKSKENKVEPMTDEMGVIQKDFYLGGIEKFFKAIEDEDFGAASLFAMALKTSFRGYEEYYRNLALSGTIHEMYEGFEKLMKDEKKEPYQNDAAYL